VPSGTYDRDLWYAGLALTGTGVVWGTARGAMRGQFASDVVATLAIIAAALLGHPVVGLVIVLMQTGGEALERYAEGRASDAVRALEAAAPRTAPPRPRPCDRRRARRGRGRLATCYSLGPASSFPATPSSSTARRTSTRRC
jgi:hypothetical protein